MKPRLSSAFCAIIFAGFSVTCALAANSKAVFTTFSDPHAGSGSGQGTIPLQITANGDVVGYYFDSNGAYHGFLRLVSGKIVEIDAPGAGTAAAQGTLAVSFLDAGLIVGNFTDSNNVSHGFEVLWHDQKIGKFVTFDAPGAGTGSGQGTFADGVNSAGTILGSFLDSNFGQHGTIRSAAGKFTNFDPVGSVATFGANLGINDAGTVAGWFIDSNDVYNGFERDANGAITSFDVPNSQFTFVTGINQEGVICGYDVDANLVLHSYLRSTDGTFTTFDAPRAGNEANQGTIVGQIDPSSQFTTGYYIDASNVDHGFVRSSQGTLVSFDAPGAGSGAGQGTLGYDISSSGAITGPFIDGKGVYHGFTLTLQ